MRHTESYLEQLDKAMDYIKELYREEMAGENRSGTLMRLGYASHIIQLTQLKQCEQLLKDRPCGAPDLQVIEGGKR